MPYGIDPATFNVLVGAGIAMVSSAFLNWNQRRVERDRFRRSLIYEVRYIGRVLDEFVDEESQRCEVDDVEEALIRLSPETLDAEFVQTTKLTTSEIEHVYEFYESARLLRRELERHRDEEARPPERLDRHAKRTLDLHDRVLSNMKRSRLSQFTETYKDWTAWNPER